ncbi:pilus assembly protein PilP [Dasania sp. GY-MA-18]|uniref:Pilus assembly protein PilP n=1 Tax=Dasania phycosphaerae TaxID=2950436 RepID=A0A9J6RLG3_9GAMM|nr:MULTISPECIES: pilus assembly protein PilP [Dasania]MCR8922417.1 pilus assembly protein PilP [Dasania sp. GY-MA-18]MCZ0864845.1 pilus assembly protein PilP [Dasania phycosphaerae]MCZ0868573.1 pilus assembly protein PilP [Dasania phycosphaerae]
MLRRIFMQSKKIILSVCVLSLMACSNSDFSDLDDFMAEEKAKPQRPIKPIPPFKTYKAFSYSATGLRSPFEKPVEVGEITRLQASSNVKPDENRTKEYLEKYGIDALSMVGTLEQGGTLWALIQDSDGGVNRVKNGNYMGRNHGRVVETAENYVAVVEIVPNGVDGWIERPRTIKLQVKE